MFFLPYQQRWITDSARLKLLEKSRQIGMSWAAAYGLVRRLAEPTARLDAWVSSRDAVQARLFLDDARKFAGLLDRAARFHGRAVLPEDQSPSALVLPFAHGVRLHSLSSNPDAHAGKRGARLLDEFALHPDPRRLYAIAYPGITWGGQLEIISTHRGAQNFFNQLVMEARHGGNPKGFSLHRVTLQDALDDGFLAKLQAKLAPDDPRREMDAARYFDFIRASCPDQETFLQEYMCVPADESTAFLPWDLITAGEFSESEYAPLEAAIINGRARPETLQQRHFYLGVDIGRVHDLTVFFLLERLPGPLYLTRDLLVLDKQPFAVQEELLWQRLSLPGLRRACLDATGLGRQLAERALTRFGARRVEAITFTTAVKEELAYPLRAAFEERSLRLPPDKFLRADLRAIKKSATASGHVRFDADRGPGGHADRFWALALALHAARTPQKASHYEGAGKLTLPESPGRHWAV